MPVYELEGKRYDVPEGTTLDELDEYISQSAAPAKPPEQTAIGTAADYLKSFGAGVGQGAAGFVGGINQAAPGLLPEPLRSLSIPLKNRSQRDIAGVQSALQRDVPKGGGEYWTQAAGRGIGAGLLAPTAVVPNALAGMGGQLGEDIATRFLGEDYGPPVGQLVGGLVGGKVGDFALRPAPHITNPTQRALMDYAEKNYGMKFTPGQYTGSRGLRNFEAGVEALPGGTGPYQAARDANLDILTRRTAKAMGVPGAADLGPETMSKAFDNAVKIMDEALPDAAQIRLRTGTRTDTQTLKGVPPRSFLEEWELPNTTTKTTTTGTFQTLDDTLDDIYRRQMALPEAEQTKEVLGLVDYWRGLINRPISGEGLKALRSKYKGEARRAYKADNTDTKSFEVGVAKGRIADALDDAVEASLGPEAAKQYRFGRQLYWTAERVLESNPSSTGFNASAKLGDAVQKAGKSYYANAPIGASEMVDLGRISKLLGSDTDSFLGRANFMQAVRQAGQSTPALIGAGAGWALGGNPGAAIAGAAAGQFIAPALASRLEMGLLSPWLKHGMPKALGTTTPRPLGLLRGGLLAAGEEEDNPAFNGLPNLFQPD